MSSSSNDKILTLSETSPCFYESVAQGLWKKLWEKEKLLVTINFSFFHSVSLSLGELPAIVIKFKIVICKPFQLEASKICLLGKG